MMFNMKQKTNYGYPLSSIFLRFLLGFILVLFLIFFFIANSSLHRIVLMCCFIALYVYFVLIYFKKRFCTSRIAVLEKMINLANLSGDETILDLGSGSGILAIGFAKHLGSGKVFGLDKYSIKQDSLKSRVKSILKINFIGNTIDGAKLNAEIEGVKDKCEFIEADLAKPFNFSDKFFDIAVSSQFLYCLSEDDRANVLKEIDRVLKKGGKIIFFESSSFMGWNINEVKEFFEEIGYKIEITPFDEFKKCCILYGKKQHN